MIINNGNIQKWFFDYVEGNLSTLEIKELENFVLEYPEYQEEFIAWKESNVKNDDDTPAFVPMNSLYAPVPFYETIYFKVSAVFSILFLTFIGGIYVANSDELLGKYQSEEGHWEIFAYERGTVNLDKVLAFHNHIFNTNSKQENLISVVINASNAKVIDFNSSINSKTQNEDVFVSNKGGSDVLTKEFYSNDHLEDIYFVDNQNLDELFNDLNYLNDLDTNLESIVNLLGDHSNRYAFLDFKNRDGFGWTKGKDKADKFKFDNELEENIAAISEGSDNSEKISKKRKKLLDNFKYIELGLGNINDPIFNIPNNNTLTINPSLSGELGITRVKTTYRNQWTASNMNSNFASLFADTYFSKIKAGMSFGVNYLNTADGKMKNIAYSYSYVQKLKVSKSANLSLGLTYSLTSINANNDLAGQKTEISPLKYVHLNNFVNRNGDNVSNLGISSWFSGKFFFGGINVTNLLNTSLMSDHETSDDNYFSELSYNMQIGTDYRKSRYSNTVLSPYLLLNKMADRETLWGGATLRHRAFVVGLSGSNNLSAKGLVGMQGNSIRILYGYDLSKSEFNQQYIGSHEVSLRILFGNKSNSNWSRYGN